MNVMNYQDYDVILDVFDSFEKENPDQIQEHFDAGFRSVVLNETAKREEYIELYRRIKEGMPDAKFKILDLTSDGETFKAKIKITGTHSKTIPSLKKGWRPMKATGKKINKIITSLEFIIRNNRILEIKPVENRKGFFAGLLAELQLLPKSYSLKLQTEMN